MIHIFAAANCKLLMLELSIFSKQLCKYATSWRKKNYFLDPAKAFDPVDREKLIDILWLVHGWCKKYFIKLVRKQFLLEIPIILNKW